MDVPVLKTTASPSFRVPARPYPRNGRAVGDAEVDKLIRRSARAIVNAVEAPDLAAGLGHGTGQSADPFRATFRRMPTANAEG